MIQDKILQLVQTLVQSKDITLKTDSTLITNGLIDSLTLIDLITHVESQFSVKFSNDEMIPENFDSVDVLTKLVESKLNRPIP